MVDARTTLAQACNPLFLYLSTFWRNSATSRATLIEVKEQLRVQFEGLRESCLRDPRLTAKYERIHYALVAAADQIVLSSSWPQRAQWATSPLEKDYFKKLEGGKRFFRLVEEVVQEPTEDAAEIAECLFTCVALGFRGELIGEKRELERTRRALFEKARMAGSLGERITPEAYNRTVPGRPIVLPTTNILRLVAVTVAALVFMVLVFKLTVRIAHSDTIGSAKVIGDALEDGSRIELDDLPDAMADALRSAGVSDAGSSR
ncbi:MAG: DotU family type IV/VI secretion system protein [Planctomycetes bacterium]|nr:DotU family type IV/VI secretion system protein [Planctomycetota bacterium]